MAAENRLDVLVTGKDELSPELRRMESNVIRAVGTISALLASIKIGTAPIAAAMEFEKELANVGKTTDFVSKALNGGIGDLDRLGDALMRMSLRVDVSAVNLAKIAAAAGQQGLGRFGVEGIVQFTDSVARMSSVLEITADEAANNLGKLVNIFKIPMAEIERASSTINEVSNRSTASGKELLDVVKRIGDATGALNIQQAAALAATGLDFGISPEVVGTAFSKVFSGAQEDAKQFAKVVKGIALESGEIMNGSTEQWINAVKNDGLGAFLAYVKGLRTLTAENQQLVIAKLTGGGRFGAMMNKFVQDTTDSVLKRNYAAAMAGKDGTSALLEQARKLATLSAQADILKNSLIKLSNDATAKFLPGLTQLTAQLSATLQNPTVVSFIQNLFQSVADTLGAITNFAKAVAGLNINWENFVRVLKAFLVLKLATSMGNMASRMTFLGVSIKSMAAEAAAAAAQNEKLSKSSKRAGAAAVEADKGFVKGTLAKALGLDVVIKKYKAYEAATAAAAAASAKLNALQSSTPAQSAALASSTAAAAAANQVKSAAGAGAATQKTVVQDVRAKQAGEAAKLEAARNAAIQKANQASADRLAQIELAYQQRRAAIVATGTEVGMKALRAERLNQIEQDTKKHQQALAGVATYYDRKTTAQKAAHVAELTRERAHALQLATARRAANTQASAANANVAGASANLAANAAAITAAKTTADTLSGVAASAKKSLIGIGSALMTFGAVAGKAAGLIVNGFAWVTILYSLADMAGIIDAMAPALQRLTDFMGFTSAKARDESVKRKVALDEEKKALAELESAQKAYKDNVDVTTGKQNMDNAMSYAVEAGSTDDPGKQQEAIGKLADLAVGAVSIVENAAKGVTASTRAASDAAMAELDLLQEKYHAKQEAFSKAQATPVTRFANPAAKNALLTDLSLELDEVGKKMNAAAAKASSFAEDTQRVAAKVVDAKEAMAGYGKVVATMFTPESAAKFQEFLGPIAEAGKAITTLQTEISENNQKLIDKNGVVPPELLEEQLRSMRAATALLDDNQKKLRDFINEQSKVPGLPKEVLESFQALNNMLFLSVPRVAALKEVMKDLPKEAYTAKNTPTPAGPSTGNKVVNLKNTGGGGGESKARKEARARLALEKAMLADINRVTDEMDSQRLEAEQRAFDKGLRTVEEYYDTRNEIMQKGITKDLKLKDQELAAVQFEINGTKDNAERMRFEADKVRILSDISVLELQRDKVLAETNNGRMDAVKAFNDGLLAERNRLVGEGIISEDARTTFENNLQELLSGAKDEFAKLRAAGQGVLVDAMTAGMTVQAFSKSMAPAGKALDAALGQVEREQSRIAAAQARGSLNAIQADQLQTQAIEAQLPALREKLRLMEESFASIRASNPLIPVSMFQQEMDAIEGLKDKLAGLTDQQNLTAKSLNESITGTFGTALDSMTTFSGSFSEIINKMLLDLANSIRKTFLDDLMSRMFSELGAKGSGGIGGYLAGVLKGGPSGSAVVPAVAGVAGAVTGVTDTASKAAETAATTAATTALGVFAGALSTVPATVALPMGGLAVAANALLPALGTLYLATEAAAAALAKMAVQQGVAGIAGMVAHTGGIIGSTNLPSRIVHPSLFANARKYHSGGMVGLKSNEVPAILQKGEQVLTKNQQDTVSAAMSGSKQGPMNIRNVLVTDPNFVTDGMSSAAGERVLMTFMQRNRASIKQALS